MGLFGKKKESEELVTKGGGLVKSVNKDNPELQDLLNEFREMRNNIGAEYHAEDEEIIEEEILEEGEEYHVSEEESDSIEDFLNSDDIEEEIIEDEEVFDEEMVEDEGLEEILDDEEEPIDDEFSDIEDDEIAEDIDYLDEDSYEDIEEVEAEAEEPIDVQVNITEVEEALSEEDTKEMQERSLATPGNSVTSEDIDKKFDEFEKRLLDKIMQQFASMNVSSEPQKLSAEKEEDELEIKEVKGQLVINGFIFTGEVVMFTPLESLNQATWEEVVRRKGHCTYHLTTSGNGGWFIKKSNAPNPYAYIEKKEEAEELAKFYASREKAELKIHNAKGVIEKSLSFGREKLRG